jgi:hypothetical protein
MRTVGTFGGLALVLAAASCEQSSSPSAVTAPGTAQLADRISEGVNSGSGGAKENGSARGRGLYELAGTSGVLFSFNAVQNEDGTASGRFRQVTVLATGAVDIEGKVTCLSIDPQFGRAWIGGVVKRNASTDPTYATDPTTQPGQDVWFRAVDFDPATGVAEDRSTFLGFAGSAGFLTSAAYCAGRPWPADNARTHLVTKGRIEVEASEKHEKASEQRTLANP